MSIRHRDPCDLLGHASARRPGSRFSSLLERLSDGEPRPVTDSVSVDESIPRAYKSSVTNTGISTGALISLAMMLMGCGTPGRFVRTDATFHEAPGPRDPVVFVDRKPLQPYRAVGTIEVTLDADATADAIRAALVPKGRQVGCNVLVEWATHEKLSAAPRAPDGTPMVLVHEGDVDRSRPVAEAATAKPQRTYRFACGIFVTVKPVSTTAT